MVRLANSAACCNHAACPTRHGCKSLIVYSEPKDYPVCDSGRRDRPYCAGPTKWANFADHFTAQSPRLRRITDRLAHDLPEIASIDMGIKSSEKRPENRLCSVSIRQTDVTATRRVKACRSSALCHQVKTSLSWLEHLAQSGRNRTGTHVLHIFREQNDCADTKC